MQNYNYWVLQVFYWTIKIFRFNKFGLLVNQKRPYIAVKSLFEGGPTWARTKDRDCTVYSCLTRFITYGVPKSEPFIPN